MLRGEIPEFVPSFFESAFSLGSLAGDAFTTPINAPTGVAYSPWKVKFVGQAETNFGAIPEPNNFILHDITKWRDVIKNPDVSDVDFEKHYKKVVEGKDRENLLVSFGGGDYFQTLVSFMGFTEALMAMYEEPEEVYALLEYVSEYYVKILKYQLQYGKPDVYMIADDCAAAAAPFFSVDMYKRLIKPFHKKHADLALESGCLLEKHDCGRSESFIDDWIDIGITGWNPAEITNDLRAIKKKYVGKLALEGGWDTRARACQPDASDDELIAAIDEYVDTFAPGGGFMFFVMAAGKPDDERVQRKGKLINDYFFSNVRDYYKTH
jgi:hypothetical protein